MWYFMIKFWITSLIYLFFIFYPAKKRVIDGEIKNKRDLKAYIIVYFFVYLFLFLVVSLFVSGTLGSSEGFLQSYSRNVLALILCYGLTYFSLKSYFTNTN